MLPPSGSLSLLREASSGRAGEGGRGRLGRIFEGLPARVSLYPPSGAAAFREGSLARLREGAQCCCRRASGSAGNIYGGSRGGAPADVERCRLDEDGSLVDPVRCWTYRVGVRAL
jgi:hypothetical protein